MSSRNNEPAQERILQDNLVFTNNQVAGYTLLDDEVRSGFRHLFTALGAILARRVAKVQRQSTAPAVRHQAAPK